MYADKLARLGIPTPVDEIVNTVVTDDALAARHTTRTRWCSRSARSR